MVSSPPTCYTCYQVALPGGLISIHLLHLLPGGLTTWSHLHPPATPATRWPYHVVSSPPTCYTCYQVALPRGLISTHLLHLLPGGLTTWSHLHPPATRWPYHVVSSPPTCYTCYQVALPHGLGSTHLLPGGITMLPGGHADHNPHLCTSMLAASVPLREGDLR